MEMVRCIGEGLRTTFEMNRENLRGIRRDYETIMKCLSDLQAYWEGPAHDTYHKEFGDSMMALERMIKKTDEIISFEETAYDKYMEADKKAAEAVRVLW